MSDSAATSGHQLVRPDNILPISKVAPIIGRSTVTTRSLCDRGLLASIKDASGRYWSSREAAMHFLGFTDEAGWAEPQPSEAGTSSPAGRGAA